MVIFGVDISLTMDSVEMGVTVTCLGLNNIVHYCQALAGVELCNSGANTAHAQGSVPATNIGATADAQVNI
eukprot:6339703-Amphidinium_carterae.1